MTNRKQIIGVVGGMGPYAGIDLAKCVFDNTIASRDQDHLPLVLVSMPEEIEDRTLFLLGKSKRNPADQIFSLIHSLEKLGVTVAGIPCNTVHAPQIFDTVKKKLSEGGHRINLLHMINEVADHLLSHYPAVKSIGLLATTGAVQAEIYPHFFDSKGLKILVPDKEVQELYVHDAIYNPNYGIKAQSSPVTSQAREQLMRGINHLREKGAEAIVLGCTEIPLALTEKSIHGIPLVNSTEILARALIRETYPEKLIPFSSSSSEVV